MRGDNSPPRDGWRYPTPTPLVHCGEDQYDRHACTVCGEAIKTMPLAMPAGLVLSDN
jgi:hypothetical protein